MCTRIYVSVFRSTGNGDPGGVRLAKKRGVKRVGDAGNRRRAESLALGYTYISADF